MLKKHEKYGNGSVKGSVKMIDDRRKEAFKYGIKQSKNAAAFGK